MRESLLERQNRLANEWFPLEGLSGREARMIDRMAELEETVENLMAAAALAKHTIDTVAAQLRETPCAQP